MATRILQHVACPVGQVLWVCAALSACESTDSDQGEARSLCPDCLAGGETTDFNGDQGCEISNLTPIERDSAIAREFGADVILSVLEQPIRSSFQWQRGTGGSAVTGYERETEIEIRVEVLEVSLAEWVWEGGMPCGDTLQLDSRIELATKDGALNGSFERPLYGGARANPIWSPNVAHAFWTGIGSGRPVNLGEFTGTLDLKLNGQLPRAGSVGIAFDVGTDGMEGHLQISPRYARRPRGITQMRARWPSNGCDIGWDPVDPDASINPADGRSARDYLEEQRSRLDADYPMLATWLDESQTEIDLELGDIENACKRRYDSFAYVTAPLRTRTLDGRLDTTQTARAGFFIDVDGFGIYVNVGDDTEAAARAAFLRQVSAAGIDWEDDFEAKFKLDSGHPQDSGPRGDLNIIGFDGDWHNRMYLHWCSGPDVPGSLACASYPRPTNSY